MRSGEQRPTAPSPSGTLRRPRSSSTTSPRASTVWPSHRRPAADCFAPSPTVRGSGIWRPSCDGSRHATSSAVWLRLSPRRSRATVPGAGAEKTGSRPALGASRGSRRHEAPLAYHREIGWRPQRCGTSRSRVALRVAAPARATSDSRTPFEYDLNECMTRVQGSPPACRRHRSCARAGTTACGDPVALRAASEALGPSGRSTHPPRSPGRAARAGGRHGLEVSHD